VDEASSCWQVPPEPAAVDEPAVGEAVVGAAVEEVVVEVSTAAAVDELLVDELLVDELEDAEPPQASAPAATARQERMVTRRRTPASLARRRARQRGLLGPLRRAQGRAHLYCPGCLLTTF